MMRLSPAVVLLAALLNAVAFLWLAHITTMAPVEALNMELLRRAASLRIPMLDGFMLLMTHLGNPWLVATLLVLAGLALLCAHRWPEVAGVALAGGGAWLLTETLKQYYQQPRPALGSAPLQVESYSFPSAHALGSLVGYGMLLFLGMRLARWRWQRVLLLFVLPLLVIGVGASRVYFGVHTLTDVLAGFLVGLAWLLIAASVVWWLKPAPCH